MKIAAKESSETLYWLILCERSETYQFDKKLRADIDEIIRVLSKIISSSKGGVGALLATFCRHFQIFKFSN